MKEPSRPNPAGEIGPIVREREELIKQRDKLVEGLETLLFMVQHPPSAEERERNIAWQRHVKQAESLLAEVRGGR